MHVIHARNVRDALPQAVNFLMQHGKKEESRNGTVLVSPVPVTIEYSEPKQHVLRNHYRDANPFFHLMESMWMLAGRDDGAFLDHYISDFSELYGTNGRIMDAYGYRWKYGLPFDQLYEAIQQLKRDSTTRQVVLQMWGAGRFDLKSETAKPCNLVITLRNFQGALDMTVFNRSNDLIWGCCGANAVHFPILQEYIAAMVGIKPGMYWQISTNLHMYHKHISMLNNRISKDFMQINLGIYLDDKRKYEQTQPLVEHPQFFDEELCEVMDCLESIHKGQEYYDGNISNSFLIHTVLPMAQAHSLHKRKMHDAALAEIDKVMAQDWKCAGKEWLERHNGRKGKA